MIIALTYAAAALAWVLRPPDGARAVIRSAWSAGAFVALAVLIQGGAGALERFIAEYSMFVVAISACANAAWVRASRFGVAALVVLFGCLVPQPAWALGLLVGVLSTQLMLTRRLQMVRLTLHWLSFVGTFAVIVPALLVARERHLSFTLSSAGLAAGVGLAAVALGSAASFAFSRGGGTPEPNDPPQEMVSSGVYRFIRHPIQWAEILAVLAAAIALQSVLVAVYCVGFAAMLKGPLRWYEEALLEKRFGRRWSEYAAEVPAYWPRLCER